MHQQNRPHYHRDRKRKRKERLIELKGGKCFDCGNIYPACCYHFDHRNPDKKHTEISKLLLGNWKVLLTEVDKCDMVCANCHAIRTQNSEAVNRKLLSGIKGRNSWVKLTPEQQSERKLTLKNSRKPAFRYPEEMEQQVLKLLADETNSYSGIAKQFKVPMHHIQRIAYRIGIKRSRGNKKGKSHREDTKNKQPQRELFPIRLVKQNVT